MHPAKKFFYACAGLLGFALTILLPRPAAAAWPNDPTVGVPLCSAAGNQFYPTIVADSAGGAIIAWIDCRNGSSACDAYAQHVLASGAVDPAWPIDGVALHPNGSNSGMPAIVSDGVGGVIVAAIDTDGVYAQHVLTSGDFDLAWPTNGLTLRPAGSNNAGGPTVAYDGAGGAIVAWTDVDVGIYTIHAQHVLGRGVIDPAWPTNGSAQCTVASPNWIPAPKVVADAAGGAIIAWADNRDTNYVALYAQHVFASGVLDPAWPANGRPLCTAEVDQPGCAAAADGTGGAIVTWSDARHGSTNTDTYAQHVLASGAVDPAWPAAGRALCTAVGYQGDATIVADGSGGAIVTWTDSRNGGANDDVYAQHVLASGAVDSAWPTNGRALCTDVSWQGGSMIVGDGAHGAIVTWIDSRNGSANADTYAQHVLASSAVDSAWPTNGRALCTANGDQGYPEAIVEDGAGGAIVTWSDARHGITDEDIYAQRVDRYGLLGGVVPNDVPRGASFEFALEPIRPNPSRGSALMVDFTLTSSAPAAVELVDVVGRRIAAREVGSLGTGHHTLDLAEGRRVAPGLYLVSLRQGHYVRVVRVVVVD